jgi:hypothetical protein
MCFVADDYKPTNAIGCPISLTLASYSTADELKKVADAFRIAEKDHRPTVLDSVPTSYFIVYMQHDHEDVQKCSELAPNSVVKTKEKREWFRRAALERNRSTMLKLWRYEEYCIEYPHEKERFLEVNKHLLPPKKFGGQERDEIPFTFYDYFNAVQFNKAIGKRRPDHAEVVDFIVSNAMVDELKSMVKIIFNIQL